MRDSIFGSNDFGHRHKCSNDLSVAFKENCFSYSPPRGKWCCNFILLRCLLRKFIFHSVPTWLVTVTHPIALLALQCLVQCFACLLLIHRGHSSFMGLPNSLFDCGGRCIAVGCLHGLGLSYQYYHGWTGIPIAFQGVLLHKSLSRAVWCHSAPTLLATVATSHAVLAIKRLLEPQSLLVQIFLANEVLTSIALLSPWSTHFHCSPYNWISFRMSYIKDDLVFLLGIFKSNSQCNLPPVRASNVKCIA